ncbi:MAG: RNA polymerase sigma factor [Planctomycetales bacterium]|nr:RNA polymerase sigma factor [Planctomycetales bacterium]
MPHLDAAKLQQLIDAHGPALTLYARQWCSHPDDAVQEAWIELVRQDPVPNSVVAWLHTAVRRRAMNLSRAEQRRRDHHRRAAAERPDWFVAEPVGDDEVDFQQLLQSLPLLDREIIVARVWGELSFAEIAALVERPLSSVHRHYQNSLELLEQLMRRTIDAPLSSESCHE